MLMKKARTFTRLLVIKQVKIFLVKNEDLADRNCISSACEQKQFQKVGVPNFLWIMVKRCSN